MGKNSWLREKKFNTEIEKQLYYEIIYEFLHLESWDENSELRNYES